MSHPEKAQLIELIKERSVERGSFTLSSSRRSSFYIDARRTTMSARGLELIGRIALEAMRERGWTPDSVGGLTLGADPVSYAVAVASRHSPPNIDAFTVRKTPKQYGTGRRIEGCLKPGGTVVILEDVITTGGSALDAIEVVQETGAVILGVLALVDREEGGRQAIEAAGHPLIALLQLADLDLSHD